MSDFYVVAVVVDPDFGDRVGELAARMPVWIVETPVNRAAAEEYWASRPELTHLDGVTTFRVDSGLTAEKWLVGVLPALDLHHGEYSHDPPYSAVEVFGSSLTPAIKEAFGQLGFVHFTKCPGGFIATKASVA